MTTTTATATAATTTTTVLRKSIGNGFSFFTSSFSLSFFCPTCYLLTLKLLKLKKAKIAIHLEFSNIHLDNDKEIFHLEAKVNSKNIRKRRQFYTPIQCFFRI